jgi:hypothetical protein
MIHRLFKPVAGALLLFWGLSPALSSAAPSKADAKACETAAVSSRPQGSVDIDGTPDTEFIQKTMGELDSFWAKTYKDEVSLDDLGLTRKVIASYKGRAWRGFLIPAFKYENVKVVLYEGTVQTSTVEVKDAPPFYDSGDNTMYISGDTLRTGIGGRVKSGAVWAFVLAHETGHHVQDLARIYALFRKDHPRIQQSLIARVELQADCLAGYWIGKNRAMFSDGEIAEIFRFAQGIGSDDHGTGAQRDRWIKKGMEAQSIKECDTFSIHWDDL